MGKSLIPVDVIVADLAEQLGDSNERYDLPVRKALLRAYKKIYLLLEQDITVVKSLIVDANNTVDLPCDFVYETKVGIKRGNVVAILKLAPSLRSYDVKLSQTESLQSINDIFNDWASFDSWYEFYNPSYNGEFLGTLCGYGEGVNTNGFYNIDRGSGILQLGSLIQDNEQVIIEYKSNGISDGFELVPTETEETLRYLAKSYFYEDRNPGLAQTNYLRYEKEYNQLKKLRMFNPVQYYDRIFEKQQREGENISPYLL